MPVVPGHVLVIPRRVVPRFQEMQPDEIADLWLAAQKIGSVVEKEYGATSITFAIQDGPQAGQTIPHVHIHVLPRRGGDFKRNDEVYTHLEKGEEERKKRSITEMVEEAQRLSRHFPDSLPH
jgi:bis(5'-adenosyl)-triphosphatase